MIRICVLGDIGSGKSYVAKNFGYPVFNADYEVSLLYRKNKKIFKKLNKVLPNYINSYPIKKNEIITAIMHNESNLKKIIRIVHSEIRKKMNDFVKKHRNKKIIVLDIPLLLENKIYKKTDFLVFIDSKKSDSFRRLKKRENFNPKLVKKFRDIQLPLAYKKKKSQFIIKNDFTKKTVRKHVNHILSKIK
tara:strand:+ start:131 stop:700 length:570 start_codon:yes stop_codon:yes gene_type:complete